jgi:hypothetical protein
MKITEHNELVDKAKDKKDGVYSYHGYVYVVKNHNFIAYADALGNVCSVHGMFHSSIGKVNRYDRKVELLDYLRRQP